MARTLILELRLCGSRIHVLLLQGAGRRKLFYMALHTQHDHTYAGKPAADPAKLFSPAPSFHTPSRVMLDCDLYEGCNCDANNTCGNTLYLVLRYR